MADFLMPALGADMTTGRVIQWLVQEGDPVKSGDVVAVVETHKGAIDVEIFLDGVIEHLAPLEQEFPVGAILAHVTQPGEQPGAAPKPATLPVAAPATQSSALPAAPSIMRAEALGSGQRISPAARRAAEALGVSLATLQGTGEGGAVT
ncbi:MAG: E3 binding domain-containing protein, partial [Gammaproteobacteria bacterium]|nr:E3 binding domain-containing protein [Gammaproteobacteria bacterium]